MDYDEELHDAWTKQAVHLATQFRAAAPGRELTDALEALKAHLEGRPASIDAASDELPKGYKPHEVPADYTGDLWIEGQVRRYGERCRASSPAEGMDRVAVEFAHRLAMNLECLILQCPASARFYDEALATLGAYRGAMNAIHERLSPTHMGEPVVPGTPDPQHVGKPGQRLSEGWR